MSNQPYSRTAEKRELLSIENSVDLEKIVRCLHQVFRPQQSFADEGIGNCKECVYDPVNNPHCRGHYPICVYRLDVGEKVSQ